MLLPRGAPSRVHQSRLLIAPLRMENNDNTCRVLTFYPVSIRATNASSTCSVVSRVGNHPRRRTSTWVSFPAEEQIRQGTNPEGGVSLRIEGLQPKSLISGAILIPTQDEPADSLNHAFTLLSETYEPWRKSHTGNVYRQVLYQEKNGKWYPLDILRKATEAKDEHQFVREQWVTISQSLNLDTNRKK